MKTEGLSFSEAGKAYFDGFKVKNRYGEEYWLDENGMPQGSHHEGLLENRLRTTAAPFSIVLPEEKSLTFDEAIEAIGKGRPIQVQKPWQNIPRMVETTRQPIWQTICFLHVAETRGWKITEVIE